MVETVTKENMRVIGWTWDDTDCYGASAAYIAFDDRSFAQSIYSFWNFTICNYILKLNAGMDMRSDIRLSQPRLLESSSNLMNLDLTSHIICPYVL